ncbi:proline dehydrogenase family protein [Rhodoferax sp. AJA081-3]|uniref:proline dehydrogenase family protein n=1 Tax=Rhodoferax sp. AJA081-3 TaxID=2752316 RepID=UPI001ADF0C36|nr:proline dehydrogenase family protein [Rhodoferax sp. AJA081-3]QTN26199.1 proline dehydrogenase family protein [Rhodoferax sp. AJA081-3]
MQLFNSVVAHAIPWIPRALVQKMARRYIAGDDINAAVKRLQQLQTQGFCATIDVLGETAATPAQAHNTAAEYLRVLDAIHTYGLHASISVKPTAMGLLLDEDLCERLLTEILQSACRIGASVCMDMEDVRCTQMQIDLFQRLQAHHSDFGLALQAYLRRTYQDIESLAHARNTLRLCKGIYREEAAHLVDNAGRDRNAINPHFLAHLARCFDAGCFVAIATHDAALIDQAVALAHSRGIDRSRFEFQMLLGVSESLRDRLLVQGFGVRIYVPFGKDWYGYSTRRLKENPRIAGHVLRAMLQR